jgi:hypothetical protein
MMALGNGGLGLSRPQAFPASLPYKVLKTMALHSEEKTMRRRGALLLATIISASAPTWGAWTALGEDDAKAIWYVDPNSIRAEGPVRQVWAMKDMAQPVTDFDWSMQFLYEVDCQGRRHRLLQYQSFKGRMDGGDPTRGGMLFGDWMAAGPGTVGGGILRAACNRS